MTCDAAAIGPLQTQLCSLPFRAERSTSLQISGFCNPSLPMALPVLLIILCDITTPHERTRQISIDVPNVVHASLPCQTVQAVALSSASLACLQSFRVQKQCRRTRLKA